MSPCCVRAMGVCQASALFGDAKQAMGEGKSGPVETGLTGPVATALCSKIACHICTSPTRVHDGSNTAVHHDTRQSSRGVSVTIVDFVHVGPDEVGIL